MLIETTTVGHIRALTDYDDRSYQGINRQTTTVFHIKALLDGDYDDRSSQGVNRETWVTPG